MKRISIAYGSIEISDGDSFVRMPHQDFKEIELSYDPIDREYTSGVDEHWEEGEYYLSNLESYKSQWLNQNSIDLAPSIRWRQFRMYFLLGNIAYNRMRYSAVTPAGVIAGGRVEDFINKESTEWAVLAGLWDFFVDCTPVENRPITAEVAAWNSQAETCSMRFRFFENAKMFLLSQQQ